MSKNIIIIILMIFIGLGCATQYNKKSLLEYDYPYLDQRPHYQYYPYSPNPYYPYYYPMLP